MCSTLVGAVNAVLAAVYVDWPKACNIFFPQINFRMRVHLKPWKRKTTVPPPTGQKSSGEAQQESTESTGSVAVE